MREAPDSPSGVPGVVCLSRSVADVADDESTLLEMTKMWSLFFFNHIDAKMSEGIKLCSHYWIQVY